MQYEHAIVSSCAASIVFTVLYEVFGVANRFGFGFVLNFVLVKGNLVHERWQSVRFMKAKER